MSMLGVGHDEFLEETAGVNYYGGVDCEFALSGIYGQVGVVDRSPSFNGQAFNGVWLGNSGVYGVGYSGSGAGGFGVRSRFYNGARSVEPIIDLTLAAPPGVIWDPCGFVPGMAYYVCDGVGTSVLHVVLGAAVRSTGLTRACRDQNTALDAEQARLAMPVPGNSVPASSQILGGMPSIRSRVISFKRDLCNTAASAASGFVSTQGRQLWDTAVTEAKNAGTLFDDRPLYWARLSMTAAVRQWLTVTPTERVALQRSVDRAARGMTSYDFTRGTAKNVMLSGFDPFSLDGPGITGGNTSASAVLGLDDTVFNGAEVQVVVFPVRYDDFDTIPPALSIVEETFAIHLASGPRRAHMIMSVSQQPAQLDPATGQWVHRFDLEHWNGRNRTAGTDNRNRVSGGSYEYPVEAPYHTPWPGYQPKQFHASTLPIDHMLGVGGCPVVWDKVLHEQASNGATPRRAETPTNGWRAVWGSGEGYLSNEVAYRATQLRETFGSPVKTGHLHVPDGTGPSPCHRSAIPTQFRQILAAGLAAP